MTAAMTNHAATSAWLVRFIGLTPGFVQILTMGARQSDVALSRRYFQ